MIAVGQTGERIKLQEMLNMLSAFFLFERQGRHMLTFASISFDDDAQNWRTLSFKAYSETCVSRSTASILRQIISPIS